MTDQISASEDILDSRDIQSRIDELEDEIADILEQQEEFANELEEGDDETFPEAEALDELQKELTLLTELKDAVNSSEWKYGLALINEDYFVTYAQELVEDTYGKDTLPDFLVIDWEATAEAIKMDYTSVEFDDTTFYYRG
jgi:hypothetical protein